jgi:hypothetical protein
MLMIRSRSRKLNREGQVIWSRTLMPPEEEVVVVEIGSTITKETTWEETI